jgi:hypothetical protein
VAHAGEGSAEEQDVGPKTAEVGTRYFFPQLTAVSLDY